MPRKKAESPYKTIKDIPPHIFKNRILTDYVGEEFGEYLRYMYDNHPDDLHYIYKRSQRYVLHGGAFKTTFPRWLKQLGNRLDKDRK